MRRGGKILAALLCPATLLVVLALGASPVRAKPVELDKSFGAGGRVVMTATRRGEFSDNVVLSGMNRGALPMIAGSEGGVLVLGDGNLTRLRENGSLDASFRESGRAALGLASSGLAIDSVGRIVVAGSGLVQGAGEVTAVTRLLADGRPDSTFGSGGVAYTQWAFPAVTEPNCSQLCQRSPASSATGVTVDSTDRIVVTGSYDRALEMCGFGLSCGVKEAFVGRFTASGAIDSAFGSGGATGRTGLPEASDPLVGRSGAPYFAGWLPNAKCNPANAVLERVTAAGANDPSFAPVGIGIGMKNRPRCGNNPSDMALDGRGRIVVLHGSAVTRLRPDGKLDKSFGNGGIARLPGGKDSEYRALTLAGREIVVVGTVGMSRPNARRISAVMLEPNGALDRSFGGDGRLYAGFGKGNTYGTDVIADNGGRLVLAGLRLHSSGDGEDAVLVRYRLKR